MTYIVEYERKLSDGRIRGITLSTAFRESAADLYDTAKASRGVVWARWYQVGVDGDIAEHWAN
jgi:hypothetical protein